MSVGLILSICFIKTLEYRLVKKRWQRLVQSECKDKMVENELTRIAHVTSRAHLPMADDSSIYHSALDLDLEGSFHE